MKEESEIILKLGVCSSVEMWCNIAITACGCILLLVFAFLMIKMVLDS